MPTSSPIPVSPAKRRHRLQPHHWRLVSFMLAVPLVLIAVKLSGLPGSEVVARTVSFQHLSRSMQLRTEHLLFTPLGALLVVFVRLTLGIRVLGPFRSVLLAIAFLVTGVVIGVLFFAIVLGAVLVLRPTLKSMRLPYFGRSTALLAFVAVIIVAAMLLGAALGYPQVERVAYFPVVVLTLTGEAFATTLRREGARSALWRATATALVAVAITALASVQSLEKALLLYPELILWCLAGVILVSELMSFRLLQHLNPPPRKKKKKKPIGAAANAAAPSPPVSTESDTNPSLVGSAT